MPIALQGYTALHMATVYGLEQIVEVLLISGASPNSTSEVSYYKNDTVSFCYIQTMI